MKRQKRQVRILGNKQIPPELAQILEVDPTFSLACDSLPLVLGRLLDHRSARDAVSRRHEEAILQDLRRLHRMHGFHSEDIILFNSLRQWGLRGVVDWLEQLHPASTPTVVMVLHYTAHGSSDDAGVEAAEYRRAFERIDSSPLRDRIVLMTDSGELRREFGAISPLPIGLLPIPHAEKSPAHDNRPRTREVTFAYFGEARADKGFHLLPELIRSVKARTPVPVRFSIQGYTSARPDKVVAEALARLEAMPHVDLFVTPLTNDKYTRLIAETDVALMPYLSNHYRSQTSGVLAEAISLGTPVIVPSGTWMATQVSEYEAGLTFDGDSATSLVSACEQAIANLPELRQKARGAAARWNRVHNPKNFVACLEDRLRARRPKPPPRQPVAPGRL